MIKNKILAQYEIKRGENSSALGKINYHPEHGCTLLERESFLSIVDMREILKLMEEIEDEEKK